MEPAQDQKGARELDELFYQVGVYQSSADYKILINFLKRFPEIAPYNALLLHIQKPGSQYVTTPKEWKKRFNRTIKHGARPLMILHPFGPVRFVFELGDTEGPDPFPKDVLQPFAVNGHLNRDKFNMLISNLPRIGVDYHEADHGVGSAGYIEAGMKNETRDYEGKKIAILGHMIVNRNHTDEEKFATIAHEIGHLYCGHLGIPIEGFCSARPGLDKNVREFEAESVSWIVCERACIHSPSVEYLSGYLNNNEEIPPISLETVLKAAGLIESMTLRRIPWRKGILAKEKTAAQGSLFRK